MVILSIWFVYMIAYFIIGAITAFIASVRWPEVHHRTIDAFSLIFTFFLWPIVLTLVIIVFGIGLLKVIVNLIN